MMNDLHDMIQVSCEEAITPDVEAQLETACASRGPTLPTNRRGVVGQVPVRMHPAVGAVVTAQRMATAHPLMMLGTMPMSTLTGRVALGTNRAARFAPSGQEFS